MFYVGAVGFAGVFGVVMGSRSVLGRALVFWMFLSVCRSSERDVCNVSPDGAMSVWSVRFSLFLCPPPSLAVVLGHFLSVPP